MDLKNPLPPIDKKQIHRMEKSSPAYQLIADEIETPEYAQLINDIRDFDWKTINRLRNDDLLRVAKTGFTFQNNGLENRRQELKAFLLEHPTCMASDFELIIQKLQAYGYLFNLKRQEEQRQAQQEQHKPKKHRAITWHEKRIRKKDSNPPKHSSPSSHNDTGPVPAPRRSRRTHRVFDLTEEDESESIEDVKMEYASSRRSSELEYISDESEQQSESYQYDD